MNCFSKPSKPINGFTASDMKRPAPIAGERPVSFERLRKRLIREDLSYDRRAIFAAARAALTEAKRRGEELTWGPVLSSAWLTARRQRAAVEASRAEAALLKAAA